MLEGQGSHAQNTLGRRIVGVVKADLDGSIAGLVESINGFTSYRVSYSKAWRAKQHAIELLYGGWREAYNMSPKLLNAIKHFNHGTKYFTYTGGMLFADKNGIPQLVLQRLF